MSDAHEHLPFIARALVTGRVTPFLGAGANRAGRPEGELSRKPRFLPDGTELAKAIAREFGVKEESYDLLQISQYVSLMSADETELRSFLHELFDAPYPPTRIHTFFAGLPARLRERSLPANDQLIVTANYDDTLERALDAAGEKFDLVAYFEGQFVHWPAAATVPPTSP